MDFVGDGLRRAVDMLVAGDARVWDAALRSLWISLASVAAAGAFGVVAGAALARCAFPGRALVVALARTGMTVPTVLIGLVGWGLLSRRGPLGGFELLYTPSAIVAGEFCLALPIVVTWTEGALRKLDPRVFETARTLHLPFLARWRCFLSESRLALALAFLTAFSRCFTELGIAMMLGGNIRGRTRTLTTATALETSRGEFERGLAMSLVIVFIGLGITVAVGFLNRRRREEVR